LGIAALEDKIVQQAVVTILNQIFEVDFKGDTQGPATGCDSPSSVASGRNRENSAPLRVLHLD